MIDQALLQQQQKRLTALQDVLEQEFAAHVRAALETHPLLGADQIKRLEDGHGLEDIVNEVQKNHALPLYFA